MCWLQLFQGNSNTYMSEMRHLDPPMIAKTVRFLPHSDQPQTVCMRVELYGCLWKGRFDVYYLFGIFVIKSVTFSFILFYSFSNLSFHADHTKWHYTIHFRRQNVRAEFPTHRPTIPLIWAKQRNKVHVIYRRYRKILFKKDRPK